VEALTWEFGVSELPSCAGPELLRGIAWKHLTEDQFACPSHIQRVGAASISLRAGANVTIECLVSGIVGEGGARV